MCYVRTVYSYDIRGLNPTESFEKLRNEVENLKSIGVTSDERVSSEYPANKMDW